MNPEQQHIERREYYPEQPSVMKELGSLLLKIAAIAVITLLLFTFVYGLLYTRDPSMAPSVRDGDLVLYYRWERSFHAGDLVVVDIDGEKQVRRIVATSGDEIDISEAGLVINGALQQERNIYAKTQRYQSGVELPLTLGSDEIFVLGDAREGVTDSRVYGAVSKDDTRGTVIALLRRRSL